jgi:hypothetical protein
MTNSTYQNWLNQVEAHIQAETGRVARLTGREMGLKAAFCAGKAPSQLPQTTVWNLAMWENRGLRTA